SELRETWAEALRSFQSVTTLGLFVPGSRNSWMLLRWIAFAAHPSTSQLAHSARGLAQPASHNHA
ncbi:MAG TPA: hypothetical protein VKC60_18195, partial [Opitutaceae bacterium]|nr:hypothetical protein [Opitutaceae bacterium]